MNAPTEDEPLEILYQDDRYVAIHKPAGLLVHRARVDRRETRFALQLLRDQIGRPVYPVHRLDRPTSGALLFALDPEALAAAMKQFEDRAVTKRYLAVTRGYAPAQGCIERPLARFTDDDARAKSDERQEARTAFRTLATSELPFPTDRYETTRLSLVELTPHTGRRHQLRRHLVHINHPIIGDTRYGDSRANIAARTRLGIHRLLLAATDLRLEHPFIDAPLHIHAPLEAGFRAALESTQLHSTQHDTVSEI